MKGRIVEAARRAAVDALLTIGVGPGSEVADILERRHLPFVTIDGAESERTVNVGIDDESVSYALMSGYLLHSSAPRFIPYIAGKVPAIIGGITIAEMVFSFPGLGRNLLEALLLRNDEQLIASVFVLLAVNAFVTFLVKTLLFVMYPRWYEKSI